MSAKARPQVMITGNGQTKGRDTTTVVVLGITSNRRRFPFLTPRRVLWRSPFLPPRRVPW